MVFDRYALLLLCILGTAVLMTMDGKWHGGPSGSQRKVKSLARANEARRQGLGCVFRKAFHFIPAGIFLNIMSSVTSFYLHHGSWHGRSGLSVYYGGTMATA